MTPAFPQELFDMCVDALACDHSNPTRIASLKSCSLVSKSFSRCARGHIYSTIVFRGVTVGAIDFLRKLDALDAMRTALQRDPHLAACVRRFEIHLPHIRDWGLLTQEEIRQVTQVARVCLTQITCAVAAAAKKHKVPRKLDTLYLTSSVNDICPIFYDQRSPDCRSPFHQAWHALGNSHSITTLHIRLIAAVPFLSLMRAFPCLQKLDIERCELLWQAEPYSYQPKSIKDRCARPREFCVDESFADLRQQAKSYSASGLEDMMSSIQTFLCKVKTLQIRVSQCHSERHSIVVDLCKGSLKTLTIIIDLNLAEGRPDRLFLPAFKLNTLGSLKNLTFEIHRPLFFRHLWANAIAQVLWRAEGTQIDTIKIRMVDVSSAIWTSGVTRHDPIEEIQAWELLDAALVRPQFAALRSVDIEFFGGLDDEVYLSTLLPDYRNLPEMPLSSALLGERLHIANHYE